jgi:Zn-dependent protease with chaperone function
MPQTKGQVAIERAYSSSDLIVLAVTFFAFFIISSLYFIISFFTSDEYKLADDGLEVFTGFIGTLIGAAILFGLVLLFGMFMVRMQRQTVLGNSLQIEYSDYAWLRNWANTVATDLQLPRIEIFVTQDPVMNAYALGFVRPYIIVLNSGTIRYLTHNEIKAIVVHEMAHIKYGHTIASVYLTPFLAFPIISVVGAWLAGFWQRRAELTADRLALMYTQDSELVKEALIKVHVGPDVAKSMNDTARQWLQYTAQRPMNRFAQTFSSHPFLVRRLSHIDRWKGVVEPTARAVKPVVPPAARSPMSAQE